MTPDGISAKDWEFVENEEFRIANAIMQEDDVLVSHFIEKLHSILDELLKNYGRLPSILSTKADYTKNPEKAILLHEEAIRESSDRLSRRLSLQSLILLKLERTYECRSEASILAIQKLFEELEAATDDSADSTDLEELEQLRERFKVRQLEN